MKFQIDIYHHRMLQSKAIRAQCPSDTAAGYMTWSLRHKSHTNQSFLSSQFLDHNQLSAIHNTKKYIWIHNIAKEFFHPLLIEQKAFLLPLYRANFSEENFTEREKMDFEITSIWYRYVFRWQTCSHVLDNPWRVCENGAKSHRWKCFKCIAQSNHLKGKT